MNIKRILSAVVMIFVILAVASCSTEVRIGKSMPPGLEKAPPAHAPAYGKRRKMEEKAPVEVAVETTIEIE